MMAIASTTPVRQATTRDADLVGDFVAELFEELYGPEFGLARRSIYRAAAAELLPAHDIYAAFLAQAPTGESVGLLTVSQCVAVYAGGRFGEINEFYVKPSARKLGLGRALIAAATAEAKRRGWPVLEVGAPDMPRSQPTYDFYRSCGFTEVGPRLELYIAARPA
ncbi:GNAT family N-acetyltransferase [Hypericibacter sp.]|uniref:GNAT family N-acetyltransferase n=1 Tax=Hypericibacter sp. TaxID=2705401 RepID=UPI003D6D53E4